MIIDIFDKLYARKKSNVIIRTLLYAVRITANMYVKYFMPIKCKKHDINAETVIVSLTTFPARIHTVWMTIACLLNQSHENMRIYLWLSKDQFNKIDDLPYNLLRLQDKGLIIGFVEDDLRSHKKYYYAFQEFSENVIVTVDDDILYNSNLISTLLDYHLKYPDAVICNRGIRIVAGKGYSAWINSELNVLTHNILPTGIGGVLYPPHSLLKDVFDVSAIKSTCYYGDDLWLNFMCRMNHTAVLQTSFKTGLITVLSSQKVALCKANCGENRNDKQIVAISQWAQNKYHTDFYYCIE